MGLLFLSSLPSLPEEPKTETKPLPWEKPLIVGRVLFRENCSVCHEINKRRGKKLGPSLFRFFQNPKTPLTGFPPTKDYMVAKIRTGGIVMPPFAKVLTNDQIDQIITFIRSKK